MHAREVSTLRRKLKLTPRQLALALGVSTATAYNWEDPAHSGPSSTALAVLAEVADLVKKYPEAVTQISKNLRAGVGTLVRSTLLTGVEHAEKI